MGKGTIISGGENGLYRVQINYDRTAYTTQIEKLNAYIAEYEEKISDVEDDITNKEAEIALETDIKDLNKLALDLESLNSLLALHKLKKMSYEKRIKYLNDNIPTDETVSAWCADYTEDLSGVVGTLEMPGYELDYLNIKPGYDSAAWATDDKQLLPEVTMSANQSYFNRSVLPAVEKWKPRYRYGTITSISGDLANVTLDAAASSQQSIGINQSATLTRVPINYMNCNGAAFKEDDEVVIQFVGRSWDNPKIIGFKDNPAPCGGVAIPVCDPANGWASVLPAGSSIVPVPVDWVKAFDDPQLIRTSLFWYEPWLGRSAGGCPNHSEMYVWQNAFLPGTNCEWWWEIDITTYPTYMWTVNRATLLTGRYLVIPGAGVGDPPTLSSFLDIRSFKQVAGIETEFWKYHRHSDPVNTLNLNLTQHTTVADEKIPSVIRTYISDDRALPWDDYASYYPAELGISAGETYYRVNFDAYHYVYTSEGTF